MISFVLIFTDKKAVLTSVIVFRVAVEPLSFGERLSALIFLRLCQIIILARSPFLIGCFLKN